MRMDGHAGHLQQERLFPPPVRFAGALRGRACCWRALWAAPGLWARIPWQHRACGAAVLRQAASGWPRCVQASTAAHPAPCISEKQAEVSQRVWHHTYCPHNIMEVNRRGQASGGRQQFWDGTKTPGQHFQDVQESLPDRARQEAMCAHDCYKEGHQLLCCATPGSRHSLQAPHCPVNALWRRFFTLQNTVGLSCARARHCHACNASQSLLAGKMSQACVNIPVKIICGSLVIEGRQATQALAHAHCVLQQEGIAVAL